MKPIGNIAPLDDLGSRPTAALLREFFGEPDHRFDSGLLANPADRARLFLVDALVHGITADPALNWAALATAGTNDPRAAPLAFFRACAGTADQRAEWIGAHAGVTLKRVFDRDELPAWEKTPLAEIAARLGLAPPPLAAIPGLPAGQSDELLRRALIFQGATGLLPRLVDLHPPFVPLLFACGEAQQREWQAALDAINHRDGVPLFPIEPFDFWATADLSALAGRTAIFCFSSKNELWHALAIERMLALLLAPQHAIWIADEFPDARLLGHLAGRALPHPVFPALRPAHPAWHPRLAAIADAADALVQRAARGDSLAAGDDAAWLSELGRNLKYEILASRYGHPCAAALRRMRGHEQWFSAHKERPPAERPTFPARDLFADLVAADVARPARRPLESKARHSIAHVVPQVIDESHAPSSLLRILVNRANRERWQPSVIALESNLPRPAAYPRDVYRSDSSALRAPHTLEDWRAHDVAAHLCGLDGGPDDAVAEANRVLDERAADIAVFHGNDPLLLLCAARCAAPRRVFVEHSGLELQRDFDLAISPLRDAETRYAELAMRSGVPVASLPYASTARDTWKAQPPDFGVGPQIKILTTISNHLESRVSGAFVEAVATILQICPNAVYAPIGAVRNEQEFRARFAPWGLQKRVMCIGSNRAPSQLCRGMHLYLNEFPFGSGIAILDAMAAGLPVVTMHDPNGPLQAQHGGNHIGVDRAITSLDPTDYVVLACQLIQNPELYREWSAHALSRFEQFGPERYVREFERILEERVLPAAAAR